MRDSFALSIGMRRLRGGGASAFSPASLSSFAWFDLLTADLFQERTGAAATTAAGVGDVVGTIVNQGTGGGYFTVQTADANRPTLVEVGGKRLLHFPNLVVGTIKLDITTTLRRGMHMVTAARYSTTTSAVQTTLIGVEKSTADYFKLIYQETNQRALLQTRGFAVSPSNPPTVLVAGTSNEFPVNTTTVHAADFDVSDQTSYINNVLDTNAAHVWTVDDTIAGAICSVSGGVFGAQDDFYIGNSAWLLNVPNAADRTALHDWAAA